MRRYEGNFRISFRVRRQVETLVRARRGGPAGSWQWIGWGGGGEGREGILEGGSVSGERSGWASDAGEKRCKSKSVRNKVFCAIS